MVLIKWYLCMAFTINYNISYLLPQNDALKVFEEITFFKSNPVTPEAPSRQNRKMCKVIFTRAPLDG